MPLEAVAFVEADTSKVTESAATSCSNDAKPLKNQQAPNNASLVLNSRLAVADMVSAVPAGSDLVPVTPTAQVDPASTPTGKLEWASSLPPSPPLSEIHIQVDMSYISSAGMPASRQTNSTHDETKTSVDDKRIPLHEPAKSYCLSVTEGPEDSAHPLTRDPMAVDPSADAASSSANDDTTVEVESSLDIVDSTQLPFTSNKLVTDTVDEPLSLLASVTDHAQHEQSEYAKLDGHPSKPCHEQAESETLQDTPHVNMHAQGALSAAKELHNRSIADEESPPHITAATSYQDDVSSRHQMSTLAPRHSFMEDDDPNVDGGESQCSEDQSDFEMPIDPAPIDPRSEVLQLSYEMALVAIVADDVATSHGTSKRPVDELTTEEGTHPEPVPKRQKLNPLVESASAEVVVDADCTSLEATVIGADPMEDEKMFIVGAPVQDDASLKGPREDQPDHLESLDESASVDDTLFEEGVALTDESPIDGCHVEDALVPPTLDANLLLHGLTSNLIASISQSPEETSTSKDIEYDITASHELFLAEPIGVTFADTAITGDASTEVTTSGDTLVEIPQSEERLSKLNEDAPSASMPGDDAPSKVVLLNVAAVADAPHQVITIGPTPEQSASLEPDLVENGITKTETLKVEPQEIIKAANMAVELVVSKVEAEDLPDAKVHIHIESSKTDIRPILDGEFKTDRTAELALSGFNVSSSYKVAPDVPKNESINHASLNDDEAGAQEEGGLDITRPSIEPESIDYNTKMTMPIKESSPITDTADVTFGNVEEATAPIAGGNSVGEISLQLNDGINDTMLNYRPETHSSAALFRSEITANPTNSLVEDTLPDVPVDSHQASLESFIGPVTHPSDVGTQERLVTASASPTPASPALPNSSNRPVASPLKLKIRLNTKPPSHSRESIAVGHKDTETEEHEVDISESEGPPTTECSTIRLTDTELSTLVRRVNYLRSVIATNDQQPIVFLWQLQQLDRTISTLISTHAPAQTIMAARTATSPPSQQSSEAQPSTFPLSSTVSGPVPRPVSPPPRPAVSPLTPPLPSLPSAPPSVRHEAETLYGRRKTRSETQTSDRPGTGTASQHANDQIDAVHVPVIKREELQEVKTKTAPQTRKKTTTAKPAPKAKGKGEDKAKATIKPSKPRTAKAAQPASKIAPSKTVAKPEGVKTRTRARTRAVSVLADAESSKEVGVLGKRKTRSAAAEEGENGESVGRRTRRRG